MRVQPPMPSLRHLLAAHPVVLLIDTASARVQIGLWTRGGSDLRALLWLVSDTEASTGLFACVEELLAKNDLRIADVNAFLFCEGPGSVLGIRTAAVALRTWRVIAPGATIYSYQSLALVARSIGDADVGVIADARRNTWHFMKNGSALRRLTTAEVTALTTANAGTDGTGSADSESVINAEDKVTSLVMPEHFRHWTTLPEGVAKTSYDLAALVQNPAVADADLFRATDEPDAFQHEDNAYVTWTPHIHQAPTPATGPSN